MFEKEKKTLKAIAKELSKEKRILKIVAYGSRVRGDFHEDSDLDLLIVVDKKDREIRKKIIDVTYSYELETGLPLSPVIFSLEEIEFNRKLGSPFIKNVEKEGIVLYGS